MEKQEIKRDFIFEFAGMPKSGKTTVLRIIMSFLKANGYSVSEYEFHGGGHYAPIDKKDIGSLNLFLAANAIEALMVFSAGEKKYPRVFFLDRGIFDRCIWTKVLIEKNDIASSEGDAMLNFLTMPQLADRLDGVFLFVTSPELSLRREAKNTLLPRTGRIMNDPFLTTLRTVSLDLAREFHDRFRNMCVIDTEQSDEQIKLTSEQVAAKILSIIQKADDR